MSIGSVENLRPQLRKSDDKLDTADFKEESALYSESIKDKSCLLILELLKNKATRAAIRNKFMIAYNSKGSINWAAVLSAWSM